MFFEWNIKEDGFDHHPGCKEMGISHLAFADDLDVISARTFKSFQAIKKTQDKFEELDDLKPSLQKCKVSLLEWRKRKVNSYAK